MPEMKLLAVSGLAVISGLFALVGAAALWWASETEEVFGFDCVVNTGVYKGYEIDCPFGFSEMDWDFLGGDDSAPDGTEGVAFFSVILFVVDLILAVVLCLPSRMTKVELGLGVAALVSAFVTLISSFMYINDADLDDGCIDGCPLTIVGCVLNVIAAILGLVFTGFCCCGQNCGPAEQVSDAKMTVEAVATVEAS